MSDILDMLTYVSFWVAVLRIATPLILGTLGVSSEEHTSELQSQ